MGWTSSRAYKGEHWKRNKWKTNVLRESSGSEVWKRKLLSLLTLKNLFFFFKKIELYDCSTSQLANPSKKLAVLQLGEFLQVFLSDWKSSLTCSLCVPEDSLLAAQNLPGNPSEALLQKESHSDDLRSSPCGFSRHTVKRSSICQTSLLYLCPKSSRFFQESSQDAGIFVIFVCTTREVQKRRSPPSRFMGHSLHLAHHNHDFHWI